jgi:hypothetical protein
MRLRNTHIRFEEHKRAASAVERGDLTVEMLVLFTVKDKVTVLENAVRIPSLA